MSDPVIIINQLGSPGPKGAAGAPGPSSGVAFSWSGGWSAGQILQTIYVSRAFTIDATNSGGWCDVGGAAALTDFYVYNTAGLLICTAAFQPSVQAPILSIPVLSIPAGWRLQWITPGTVDLNLTSPSLTLAAL